MRNVCGDVFFRHLLLPSRAGTHHGGQAGACPYEWLVVVGFFVPLASGARDSEPDLP